MRRPAAPKANTAACSAEVALTKDRFTTARGTQPAPDAPGVRVEQLRLVTDRALSQGRAQALGAEFTRELDAALQAARPRGGHLHVNELVIEAAGHRLESRRSLQQLAQAAAQRILDRTPE